MAKSASAHSLHFCCAVNSGEIGRYELFRFVVLVLHCCLGPPRQAQTR